MSSNTHIGQVSTNNSLRLNNVFPIKHNVLRSTKNWMATHSISRGLLNERDMDYEQGFLVDNVYFTYSFNIFCFIERDIRQFHYECLMSDKTFWNTKLYCYVYQLKARSYYGNVFQSILKSQDVCIIILNQKNDKSRMRRIFFPGKIFVYKRLTNNSAIKMKSFVTQPFGVKIWFEHFSFKNNDSLNDLSSGGKNHIFVFQMKS